MKERINIRWDEASSRFLLTCPFYANELVKGLASVRWLKGARAWGAPNIRKNVEHIDAVLRQYADITEEAEAQIAAAKGRFEDKAARAGGFPSWYQFKMEPLPHQLECLQKLYGKEGAAIFMDPGLGKSKTVIDLNCALRMEGKIDSWLVICKLSLVENFAEQIAMHAPIPVDVHIPSTDKRKEFERWALRPHDFKCLIVGTESLSNGRMIEIVESYLLGRSKPSVTLDESSMIAGHKATRSERIVGLRTKSAYRQALTGTPIAEGPLNLFMQFEFIDPDIIGIGDFYAFRNRYAVMGGFVPKDGPMKGKPVQIVGYQNLDELTRTVAPYTYEANKSILKLPPKSYQVRHVDLTPEQRALYRQIKIEKKYYMGNKEVVTQNVLELILRLQQVCGGFIGETYSEEQIDGRFKRKSRIEQIVPDDKNPKLIELLDVANETRGQGIVWTAFRAELAGAERVLAARDGADQIRTLHGDTPKEERQAITRDFEAGKFKWLLSNPQTGGMGFTWNAAEVMVYISNTNKLIDRIQSEDRAHRIGQDKTLRVIDIVARSTVDEAIKKANDQKYDMAQFIRDRIAAHGRAALDNLLDGVL